MKARAIHIIFILLMSVMLAAPVLNSTFNIISDLPFKEKRQLAKPPKFNLHAPDSFSKDFNQWINDHFSFRNLLLNARMNIEIHAFKQSPVPQFVIIGKDNWLFNTGNEIEVYRGTNRFDESELEQLFQDFNYRKEFIQAKSAKLYYVVAPIKYSIYPEYLPFGLTQKNKESRTDQFVNYMQKKGIPVIDLREVLLRAKNDTFPLYYKGDNHWNFNGAFIAYQEIIRVLNKDFPSLGPPLEIKDFVIKKKPNFTGNLSNMLFLKNGCDEPKYIYKRLKGDQTREEKTRKYKPPPTFAYKPAYENRFSNGNTKAPKILIIRDSFGANVTFFLKQHFRETVTIFDEWKYRLNPDIIEQEKPDIVMFIVLESMTGRLLMYPSKP